MPFTPQELAEMAKADAAIEAEFVLSNEEYALSRQRDRRAVLDAMDASSQRIAEYQRRYYAANKEKLAEYHRRYRAANREQIAESHRRYYAANREQIAESHRRYYAANREQIAESKQALKHARLSLGLSQIRAADLIGVTQATISNWERVKAPDNWAEIVQIMKRKAAARAGTSHDRSH